MRDFIISASQANKIATSKNHSEIRAFLKKIGSNFILKDKKLEFEAEKTWRTMLFRIRHFSKQERKVLNPRPRFWRPVFYR